MYSFIEVETESSGWITINVSYIKLFRKQLNGDLTILTLEGEEIDSDDEILLKQTYEEFSKFFAYVIQESEDGSIKDFKKKPWTWRELPSSCPLYASVEDVKNNTPIRDLKDGDDVITLMFPGQYIEASITGKDNVFRGESGDLIFGADFSKEQDCWVQHAVINRLAFEKIVKGL